MSVKIISHCYAETLPHFAGLLCYQLSSLVLYPPKIPTTISICYVPSDRYTSEVLEWFKTKTLLSNQLELVPLTKAQMVKRCIGRNISGLDSPQDLIWFTDVDYVFGQGSVDALYDKYQELLAEKNRDYFIYPKEIMIQKTHIMGDRSAKIALSDIRVRDIELNDFVPHIFHRAIGGVQIVSGQFIRKHGYLNGHKFQKPDPDGKPFASFNDDLKFRGVCRKNGMHSQSILVPGISRLRHTKTSYK